MPPILAAPPPPAKRQFGAVQVVVEIPLIHAGNFCRYLFSIVCEAGLTFRPYRYTLTVS